MNQQQALDILKMGKNVFLTGSAGAGKTYVLNQYIDFLRKKNVAIGVTASTGIAATHSNGMTIHAWSGIGVREFLSERDIVTIMERAKIRRRFLKTQVLIIDEVSMIGAHMLDMLDELARVIRNDERPFGGMQVVVTGDFFQLPPVSKDREVQFANQSRAWQNARFTVCYLDTQYRQKNDQLTSILNDIRDGKVTEKTRRLLQQRSNAQWNNAHIHPTKLYTHNVDVDTINARELAQLSTPARRYNMVTDGPRGLVDALVRACLAPQELMLRVGATVMFVRNNFDEGYVNGTLGTVVDFTERGFPVVQTLSGEKIVAQPEVWEIEEDGKVKASIKQIPLRLAWAITVHKSQGMTLDAAEIDLSKSFVAGMGYVALSRVRSLDGLILHGLNDMALRVNDEVRRNDRWFQEQSVHVTNRLRKMSAESLRKLQEKFLASVGVKSGKCKISTQDKTWKLFEQGLSIEEVVHKRGLVIGTIISHVEHKMKQGNDVDFSALKKRVGATRMKKIHAVFADIGAEKLTPVRNVLGSDYTFDEIRIARMFWRDAQK